MFIYREKGLLRGVVCLDGEPGDGEVDRIGFLHPAAPLPGANCKELISLFLDLGCSFER
jgi:hypothetical protein